MSIFVFTSKVSDFYVKMNSEPSTSEQGKETELRDEQNSELPVFDPLMDVGYSLFAQNQLLERTTFENDVNRCKSDPVSQRREQILSHRHVSLPPLSQLETFQTSGSESFLFQPLRLTAPPDKLLKPESTDFSNISSFATGHKFQGVATNLSHLNLPSKVQEIHSKKDDPDIARVDGQLSLFCKEAKEKVMSEIYRLKTTFGEQIEILIQEERERYLKEQTKLQEELKEMKLLVESYKKSLHYKECIINNLTEALQKQKDKHELMKVFHAWRIQYVDEQREKFTNALASEYYKRKLKQRVWKIWREIIESNWKKKIEQEVKIEAEGSKQCLIDEYENKIKELQLELKESNAKCELLQAEHKSYEDKMKQALMRGVCALNMEAMSVFSDSTENSDKSEEQQKISKHGINLYGSFGATDQGPSLSTGKQEIHMEYSSLQPCSECLWCPSEIVHEKPVKCISPMKESISEAALAMKERKVHHSSQPKAISLAGTSTVYSPNLTRLGSGNKNFATPRTSVIVQRHTPLTKNH